jgi:hypothetical protein
LGTWSTPDSKAVSFLANAIESKLSFIPGISSNWFAILRPSVNPQSSVVLTSADEFKTSKLLELTIPNTVQSGKITS